MVATGVIVSCLGRPSKDNCRYAGGTAFVENLGALLERSAGCHNIVYEKYVCTLWHAAAQRKYPLELVEPCCAVLARLAELTAAPQKRTVGKSAQLCVSLRENTSMVIAALPYMTRDSRHRRNQHLLMHNLGQCSRKGAVCGVYALKLIRMDKLLGKRLVRRRHYHFTQHGMRDARLASAPGACTATSIALRLGIRQKAGAIFAQDRAQSTTSQTG